MNKKYNTILATLLFSLTFQSIGFAAEKTRISIDGFVSTTASVPTQKSNKLFVGIKDILNITLGLELKWHEQSQTLSVIKGGKTVLQITPGKDFIYVNGQKIEVTYTPYIENEDIMVPLELLVEQFDLQADYDEKENIVIIKSKTNTEDKVVVEKREGTLLTFEKAVELAKQNSSAIKSVLDSHKLAEAQRDEASKNLVGYNDDNTAIYGPSSQISAILSLMQTELTLKSTEYNKTLQEIAVEMSVKDCFNKILGYENDIAYKKLAIANSKKNLDVLQKKLELGLESQFNFDKQKVAYEQATKEISDIEISIDSEYTKLYSLIDVSGNNNYVISYELGEYEPIGDITINTYVNQHEFNNPAIKIKQLNVDSAINAMRTTSPGDANYQSRQNSLNQANRDLSDARDNFAQKIRTSYNTIRQTEQQYTTSIENMEQLKKDYDMMKIKYNSGMASAMDVENLNIKIAELEYNIKKIAINLDSLRYSFERPYF